jgi:hypothetical protein
MLPGWANDIAAVSSIVGLGVTLWLLWEARKLRTACLRRARLPQLYEALKDAIAVLADPLAQWDSDRKPALYRFQQVSAHLDGLLPKLDPKLREKARALQNQMRGPGVWRFWMPHSPRKQMDERSAEDVWQLYCELSAFVTSLNNSLEDSSWQQ